MCLMAFVEEERKKHQHCNLLDPLTNNACNTLNKQTRAEQTLSFVGLDNGK